MMFIAIYLLSLSFNSLDNETLKLLGESKDHVVNKNQRIDRKLANVFVMISFFCVICGGLAVAASWSQEAIINYIFGYANLILMAMFMSVGMSIIILQCKWNYHLSNLKISLARVVSDFAKECATTTGKAHQIDTMYKQGSGLLCTD